MDLSPEELRVLGCLVEKRLTTPQQYPLTLNALTLACNQTSSRDPVVDYHEDTVEAAVTRAKTLGLAAFVHPSHGRSALRYRHTLDDRLGLGDRPLAILAVLVLRGPQTVGELRSRTERMVSFDGAAEVQAELDALAERDEPLVARAPRGPGQKEDRYAHLLGGAAPGDSGEEGSAAAPAAVPQPTPRAPSVTREPIDAGHAGGGWDEVRAELARQRTELEALRRELEALRAELGS